MPVDSCLQALYDGQMSDLQWIFLFLKARGQLTPHIPGNVCLFPEKDRLQRPLPAANLTCSMRFPWRRKFFQCGGLGVVPFLLLHRYFTGLGDAVFACLKQPFHVHAGECAWQSPCGTGLTTQPAATTFFQVTGKLEQTCLVLHHFCFQTWLLWTRLVATDVPQSVGSSGKHWVYTLSC